MVGVFEEGVGFDNGLAGCAGLGGFVTRAEMAEQADSGDNEQAEKKADEKRLQNGEPRGGI